MRVTYEAMNGMGWPHRECRVIVCFSLAHKMGTYIETTRWQTVKYSRSTTGEVPLSGFADFTGGFH